MQSYWLVVNSYIVKPLELDSFVQTAPCYKRGIPLGALMSQILSAYKPFLSPAQTSVSWLARTAVHGEDRAGGEARCV